MSAHTPGPWTAEYGAKGNQIRARGEWVASVAEQADTRLIAAAPALLEALEACEKALEHVPHSWGAALELEQARAAIALAKGEKNNG